MRNCDCLWKFLKEQKNKSERKLTCVKRLKEHTVPSCASNNLQSIAQNTEVVETDLGLKRSAEIKLTESTSE